MSVRQEIFESFRSKSCLKQDVNQQTIMSFAIVKEVLEEISTEYKAFLNGVDERVVVTYKDHGPYGASIGFGGDVLLFQMHSNVFSFEDSHPIHKNSYVTQKTSRAYCGIINVYNFLSDSFKFNRKNDMGFLISRIFVNEEQHLFVEGKNELSYKYADFSTQLVSKELLTSIIESSIKFALDFDLYTPDFLTSQLVTVAQMQQLSKDQKTVTSKRLGFRMTDENDALK